MFYGRCDVADNGDKIDEIGASIPVGSPIHLTGEQIRMCLRCIVKAM